MFILLFPLFLRSRSYRHQRSIHPKRLICIERGVLQRTCMNHLHGKPCFQHSFVDREGNPSLRSEGRFYNGVVFQSQSQSQSWWLGEGVAVEDRGDAGEGRFGFYDGLGICIDGGSFDGCGEECRGFFEEFKV